jgi:transaldolase
MSRLGQLSELGQSVWIDYLSRELLDSGALARAVRDDSVAGVTSNPFCTGSESPRIVHLKTKRPA